MDTGIRIGGDVSKGTAENVSTGLVHILRAGFESHSDQETIRMALQSFSAAVRVENVSITNCTIDGDKNIAVN